MAKAFFDVFPGLKLDGKLKSLFEQTQIERVTATKQKDFVRIYLSSERLIQKDDIFTVEGEIKKQLFAGCNITIKIHEKYRLSSQYNPEKLMEIYRDSILLELQEYSHLLYSMFKNAELSFPEEGRLNLRIEDTVLARTKSDELTRILEKVFFERCGLPVNVFVEYREARTGRFKEEDDIFIARRVAEIAARYTGNKGYENGGEMPAPRQEMQAGQSGNAEGGAQKQAVDPAYEAYLAGAAKEAAKAESGQKPKDGGAPFEGGTVRPGAALEGKKFMGKKSGGFGRGKGKFKGDGDFFKSAKRSDNPDVIYGRDFDDEAMSIEDIVGEIGEVAIRGKILNLDKREIKNERTILIFDVTDFSDTMTIKMFAKNEQVEEICEGIKPGVFVKIKGITMIDKFDGELTIGSIVGVKKISDFTHGRMDHSVRKRVELHCHTKMSDMDGVSEAKDIVKRAYQWGHPAIAITDHGVVQSFPDANHLIDDLWKTEKGKRKDAGDPNPDKNDFFKVIYGVEAYLVDDLKEIVTDGKGQPLEGSYVVFDIETTGFSPIKNRIIEIGAVKVINGEITDRFSSFVNPQVPIPFEIEKLTSINDEMVMDAPVIEKVLPEFLSFCEGTVLVAHNASFDISFIRENAQRQQLPFDFTYVDTVGIARVLLPHQAKHTLDAVSKTLGISLENHHRAVDDAEATAQIFVKFTDMLLKDGKDTLEKVNALGDSNPDIVKRLPTYHAIILAKNNTGRVNLYKLISESHLTYYAKRPRIPKSLLLAHREGLILGSACEAGELYRALLDDRSDADIARIVNFYDYLEIQPTGNNKFMINEEKIRNINSIEDIQDVNKRIVALGEQYNKPVVATCDVHFLDPGDEVYRRIIMAGKGFKDSDEQAPLYLRTTEEMLEEFQYLGSDKAEEVVITNTNLIADQIETISPVRPDKCPPVIADSDKTLTEICYNKAHEMYGEKLPPIVEQRLEKELNSIIKNGFAVMYIIAQKLVWKSGRIAWFRRFLLCGEHGGNYGGKRPESPLLLHEMPLQ